MKNLAILIVLFCVTFSFAQAQKTAIPDFPKNVKGMNVSHVAFAQGSFRQTAEKVWIEHDINGNQAFIFNETNRDEWSVYLKDKGGKRITLNLWTKKINLNDNPLYEIIKFRAVEVPKTEIWWGDYSVGSLEYVSFFDWKNFTHCYTDLNISALRNRKKGFVSDKRRSLLGHPANDQIESIFIPAGFKVTLYEDPGGHSGDKLELYQGMYPNLGWWNGKTSGYKVEYIGLEHAPVLYLSNKEDFRGIVRADEEIQSFRDGSYTHNKNDGKPSLMIPDWYHSMFITGRKDGSLWVSLYEHPDFETSGIYTREPIKKAGATNLKDENLAGKVSSVIVKNPSFAIHSVKMVATGEPIPVEGEGELGKFGSQVSTWYGIPANSRLDFGQEISFEESMEVTNSIEASVTAGVSIMVGASAGISIDGLFEASYNTEVTTSLEASFSTSKSETKAKSVSGTYSWSLREPLPPNCSGSVGMFMETQKRSYKVTTKFCQVQEIENETDEEDNEPRTETAVEFIGGKEDPKECFEKVSYMDIEGQRKLTAVLKLDANCAEEERIKGESIDANKVEYVKE